MPELLSGPGARGEGPPRYREGVPAAATHAGAGSGGGAERSRPGPPPRRRLGHPPGAVASRPGVYEPGPQAHRPPPGGGAGTPM